MDRRIARRQPMKVVAIDAVAFPVIAFVFLTQPSPTRFFEAIVIFFAAPSLQAVLFVQGVRESRALR